MNWEAIGAIGEIVGAIAVVITLIYLAAQMKINTAAINRSATQSILQGRAETSAFIAGDSEISALWWNGAANPDSITKEEWERFILVVSGAVKPLELAYPDHAEGRMSDKTWEAQSNALSTWFTTPGFKRWTEQYGHTLNPDFRKYLETLVREAGD